MDAPSVSIVIPTYNRWGYIGPCLEHVRRQTVRPREVVVVDSSPGYETQEVVARFPEVSYCRSPHGRGTTGTSRALGLEMSTGEVVAYLDDDAYPAPTWLEELLKRYDAPDVAGVGGRADNGRPEEESEGVDRVGRLLPNGHLTGYFSAITPADVEVDHLLGANMSMRRQVIQELGGIRDYYPGTCLREESDIALRARAAGYRLIYTPEAVVRHVGGTYARGRRFDFRYEYYAARNHVVLLRTALDPRDPRAKTALKGSVTTAAGYASYAARSVLGRRGGGRTRLGGFANGSTRALISLLGAAVGWFKSEGHLRDLRTQRNTPS